MSRNSLLDLGLDEVKLKTAKGLSIAGQKFLVTILLLSLVNMVLISLAVGVALILGHVLGDYAVGAFIVSGLFLLVALVVFLLRKRLFVNSLVRMFVRIFFEDKADDEIF